MSETQIDAWVEQIARLPDLINGEWLESEVASVAAAIAADKSGGRRQRKRHHPLAELTHQVREELKTFGTPSFQPTLSIAKLGALAFAIQRLRKANGVGLDDRLERLTGASNDFESTRFELEVASLHVVMNRQVRFVPEASDVRTPDLEIDEAIEIECKRKVELSKDDLAMRDLWGLLERRLYDSLGGGGAYRVELSTRAAPTRADVDWVLAEVRRTLSEASSPFDFTLDDSSADRRLRFCSLTMRASGQGVGVVAPPDARSLDEFDVAKLEITARRSGRSMEPWGALQFCFGTAQTKDWVEGVRRSLKTARGQLSGTRPGVVYVEVPAAVREQKEGRLGQLKPIVDETFRNSSRTSAVVIAFTGWDDEKALAVAQYHLERNPSAKHPIPTNFYVSLETRQQWRRTIGRNKPCPCGSGTKFKHCCHP